MEGMFYALGNVLGAAVLAAGTMALLSLFGLLDRWHERRKWSRERRTRR